MSNPNGAALRFYLGAHHPSWLETAGVPLFVSYGRLQGRKRLPRAAARWALDSRGFSELSQHGRWTISPRAYARDVQRYIREIGRLDWASVQDWMCEPVIRAKTGLTVEEHQERTVRSWLELRELAPEVPWAPVLQGWTLWDYLRHVEAYDRADRTWREGVVGVGSVCRRQTVGWVPALFQILHAQEGLRLHAFGFKRSGLPDVAHLLESTDSLAWSFDARRTGEVADNAAARPTRAARTVSPTPSCGVTRPWPGSGWGTPPDGEQDADQPGPAHGPRS